MFVGALSRYPPHVHRGWRYESWELDLPFSPLLQPARDGRAVDQGGRKPPTGPGYPVIGSGPTRSASYSGSSPTTSAICCVGSSCRSEEHTSELQSLAYLVCRLLLEKKKKPPYTVRILCQEIN